MRDRQRHACAHAVAIVALAAVIALIAGLEAAASLLPLVLIVGATVGDRYAGADRLVRLAERVAARHRRRVRTDCRVPLASRRAATLLSAGRLIVASTGSRAPPYAGLTAI